MRLTGGGGEVDWWWRGGGLVVEVRGTSGELAVD